MKCVLKIAAVLLVALAPQGALAAASLLPQTGQKSCYDTTGYEIDCSGTGQDGDLKKGARWSYANRFTYSENGAVTDNLTRLVWLRNAGCFGDRNWQEALDAVATLADGTCGLTDGSVAGEWRLPNVTELESLLDASQVEPSLPLGHSFINVASWFWTSTSSAEVPYNAWCVDMSEGFVEFQRKDTPRHVWPVRTSR